MCVSVCNFKLHLIFRTSVHLHTKPVIFIGQGRSYVEGQNLKYVEKVIGSTSDEGIVHGLAVAFFKAGGRLTM